jgi:hypothetical protein
MQNEKTKYQNNQGIRAKASILHFARLPRLPAGRRQA